VCIPYGASSLKRGRASAILVSAAALVLGSASFGGAAQESASSQPLYPNPFVVDGDVITLPLSPGFWSMRFTNSRQVSPDKVCLSDAFFKRFEADFAKQLEVRDCNFSRKQWKNGVLDLAMQCTDKNGPVSVAIKGSYSSESLEIQATEDSAKRGRPVDAQISLLRQRDCQPGDPVPPFMNEKAEESPEK
jgi:hypothetical protein